MGNGVIVPDRKKALILLAESRYEVYAPGPKLGRTFAAGKAAPTKKQLCLLCDGDRVTRDKFGRESTCESCQGRGYCANLAAVGALTDDDDARYVAARDALFALAAVPDRNEDT